MTIPPNPDATADGIQYGHLYAMFTEGAEDGSVDLDPYPNENWLTGTVTLRPSFDGRATNAALRVPGTPRSRAMVIDEVPYDVIASRLVDRQGREGVWLIIQVGDIPIHWQATVILRDKTNKVILQTAYILTGDSWVTEPNGQRVANLPDLIPNPGLLTPPEGAAILSAQASMNRALDVAAALEEAWPTISAADDYAAAARGSAQDSADSAALSGTEADRAIGLADAQDAVVASHVATDGRQTQTAVDSRIEHWQETTGNATYETLDGAKVKYQARYRVYDVVADFGADSTGVTSASAALDAAITAANSTGGKCVIYLPNGTYDLTAGTAVPVTAPDVVFLGAGDPQTMVKCATGTVLSFGTKTAACYRGGASNMRFWYSTTPTADTRLFDVPKGGSLVFDRIGLDGVCQLARLGTAVADSPLDGNGNRIPTQANNITFSHIRGQTANIDGSIVIDAVAGSTLNLDDIIVNNNCGFPGDGTIGKSDPHPAMDTRFCRFGAGGPWDTLITNMVHTNRYGIHWDMAPQGAGMNTTNLWFTSVVSDYGKTNGLRFAPAAGGYVMSVWVVAGWFVANDGRAIETKGPGQIRNLNFTATVGRQSGKSNWFFGFDSNLENVRLTNCYGIGANRLFANNTGSDQDDLVLFASGVHVLGGEFGVDGSTYTGLDGNQARYGMTIGSDITYSVSDATFAGKTGRVSVPLINSAASKNRRLSGNRTKTTQAVEYAMTYTLSATPPAGQPAFPASGADQLHTGGTTDTLYIYGGTVTSIQHNSMEIATSGPATIILRPGDVWKLIYSVAPTVRRMVAP